MMKSKLLNGIVAFSLFSLAVNAQTPVDALRLSIAQPYSGTARTMGVGGAMGALGADYSAISINPAGLASFRTSEFVITPGYNVASTDAILYNKTQPNSVVNDGTAKFYLSNCAFVRARRPEGGDWTTQNWSIGFSRLKTFDASFYFKGESLGSIVNRFQEKANNPNRSINPFEDSLAIEVGAVYYKKLGDTEYGSDFNGNTNPVTKSQQGLNSGRINQLDFSYAANYKEKIQIGASIGVPFMSFYDNKIYQETDVETAKEKGLIPAFKALKFQENYGVTGRGVNAKLGVIFKPIQSLRIGAAIQTPISYKLSETYTTDLSYTFWQENSKGVKTEYTYEAKSPDGSYDYIIRTPWRLTGSAAILAGKSGFVSLDVDYIDYSKMAFQYQLEDKDVEIDINDEIRATYIATSNFRLGGEFTKDIFRFRAGLGLVGLPVRVDNPDYFRDATKTYSLGVGLREKKFYFDVAYQFARSSDDYRPYRVSSDYDQQIVARTQNNSQFIGTLGFKF